MKPPPVERLKEKTLGGDVLDEWIEVERIRAKAVLRFRDLHPAVRQARVLEAVLRRMPIRIEREEILAGSQAPCFTTSYDLYAGGAENPLEKQAPDDLRRLWEQDPYNGVIAGLLTREEKTAAQEMIAIGKRVTAHCIPDFERVLNRGLEAIIAEAAGREEPFHRGVVIALKAACGFARRFSRLARKMARGEPDAERRAQLTWIARTCGRVPAKPARDFYEALQSFWFTYLIMTIEQAPNAYAFSVGRFDQWMLPFYERTGASREEAKEWIKHLWLKFVVGKACWAVSQNILLGGRKEDGADAVNELTYALLEATHELNVPQPSAAARVHRGSPARYKKFISTMLAKGGGIPALHNDEAVIPAMIAQGYSEKDACNYVIAGCQEYVAPGCDNSRTTGGKFNLLKCLELTLNEGRALISGAKVGISPGSLETYDDLVREYRRQVEHFTDLMVSAHNRWDRAQAQERPAPFLSALVDSCLERGRDFRADGARYNFTGVLVHGLGSTADALAALKKFVYEEKKIQLDELRRALLNNFEGCESLRLTLLNRAPKFGNDDPAADAIAADLFAWFNGMIGQRKNAWGGRWRAGFNTPSTHVHYGYRTGATPDGRRAGEALSYGTGPADARAKLGPTAVIRSVTAFDHSLAGQGTDLSLSIDPTNLRGEERQDKLTALFESLFERGACHVHFNAVSADTLRDAKKRPERHPTLIVRIHGFSTHFTSLAADIQDDVIRRVENEL
ncbi:MAG: pyruvate formate lyase family protein [bacterium]